MERSGRRVTASYALIQSLYCVTSGLMFNFASAYLLDRGFTNGGIGALLGAAYGLSAVLQPLLTALFNRAGVRLSAALACAYVPVALCAAALLALPLKGASLAAVMIAALTLQSALQPSVNSLHRGFELSGLKVNFALARGIGSAAFSLCCFLMGRLLRRTAPSVLPACYLATLLLMVLCLARFRSPGLGPVEPQRARRAGEAPLLRRQRRFALFLPGLICLSFAHLFVDTFMLQIMRSVGGDSAGLGAAIAVAALTELPAMLLYSRVRARLDSFSLLRFAGWAWVAKIALVTIARSPQAICAAELMQFFSYAVYVPAAVDYIARTLPPQDFLKGQALAGSAFTLGSLLATFLGGRLVDWMGVRGALPLMSLVALSGALLFTAAVPRGRRIAHAGI